MIKKKIKSIWHGKVAIHEKYFNEAKATKQGLELWYQGELMEVPFEKLSTGKVSKEVYRDRHSGTFYKLIYFPWKPQVKQKKLL